MIIEIAVAVALIALAFKLIADAVADVHNSIENIRVSRANNP